METRVQRAILLKALMEALNKTKGMEQAVFQQGKAENLRGHFTRFNANAHTLNVGLDSYLETVRAKIDGVGDALPSDPIWQLVKSYVYGDAADSQKAMPVPGPLNQLAGWNQLRQRPHHIKEMGGCWYLCRLSTGCDLDDPEFAVSLLNIKTADYYQGRADPWTEFALFLHQETADDPTTRIDGICFQYHTNLHLIGLLDKDNSPVPTAIALRYEPGSVRSPKRRLACEGVLFGVNSHGRQISAPLVAAFVPGSDEWPAAEYRDRRAALEKNVGTKSGRTGLNGIIPASLTDTLLKTHSEYFVFQAH